MEEIPVAGPSITEREISAVTEAVTRGWFGRAGYAVEEFEQAFASMTGRRYAIALPSCTAAIHLSLLALGIGEGDEVIVPECTWIASAAPVAYVGAEPVFADIDSVTWCITPEAIERRITVRTKAVIAVDLYGSMPDYERLEELCAKRGIALIEDAAEAIGSMYNGKPAGAFGATAVFSFHGSKTMTTGEGGMVVTDDEELYGRMSILRDHGRVPGDVSFFNREVGFKYKMTDMQAALGLAQLQRLDELVALKRRIFGWYEKRLADIPGALNAEPEGVRNSYWMTTVVFDEDTGLDKATVRSMLQDAGIASRPFFYPLSSIPAYESHPQYGRAAIENPVAHRLSRYGANLPSALTLTESEVNRVCVALRRIAGLVQSEDSATPVM